MCGIAGILGLSEDRMGRIASRISAGIAHRGPDDCGQQAIRGPDGTPTGLLLHARLAVLDLTPAGHQPMCDHPPDGSPANWVVFNGEVFNYRDFHAELDRAGWPCRSRSDTEVILHGYRVWGEQCVERFRGMFAWCLTDMQRGVAWFCRDRLGIKPLYLFWPESGGLLFASELRALLSAGADVVPPEIDPQALESFLAQGAVVGERGIVRGIRLLRPGESLWTDLTGREIRRRTYWTIPPPQSMPPPRQQAVKALGEQLRQAVRLRLISDVPLGLFLSGGIDSAALAVLATEVSGTRLTTVNVGYDQPEFDESREAASVARKLGTEHLELKLTGRGVLEDLPAALAAMDQPTVDGFNVYFVSRAARRAGLTVALSGLGGDELFGGYASFRDVPRAARLQRWLRRIPGAAMMARGLSVWNQRWGIKSAQVLRRRGSLVQMYLLRRELFLTPERRGLLELPDGCDADSGIPRDVLGELQAVDGMSDPVDAVSRLELSCYMRHMLLRDADAFSMAHALELRVPLLDHKVVELVAGYPGEWKRPDPRPKPLLVDAVGGRLPAEVYAGKKRGFTLPWRPWFRGALRDRAARAAGNDSFWHSIGLKPAGVLELWRRFDGGDRRVAATQVLALVVLEDFATRHGLRRSS